MQVKAMLRIYTVVHSRRFFAERCGRAERLLCMKGLIIKNTSDVRMAELLEPEKGRNHPVRGALSVSPEDKRVNKAVNEVLEKHGVKVK